eukprot:1159354-Pelagomonas_calceolata.AAC.1
MRMQGSMRGAFPKLNQQSTRARATNSNAPLTPASASSSGLMRRRGLFSAVTLVAGAWCVPISIRAQFHTLASALFNECKTFKLKSTMHHYFIA